MAKNIYKCKCCGFEGDYQKFVDDYIFDTKEEDEIATLKCPKCGADEDGNSELLEEVG